MTRNTAAAKQLDLGDITSAQHRPISPNLLPAWKPGQSGNPSGRPRGARSKLAELTLTKLLADFELHGTTAIEEVRKRSPANYLAAVVSLLPKQQEKIESPFADLSEEELDLLEAFLKSTRAKTVTTIDAQPIACADAGATSDNRERADVTSLSDAEIDARLDAALNSKDRT